MGSGPLRAETGRLRRGGGGDGHTGREDDRLGRGQGRVRRDDHTAGGYGRSGREMSLDPFEVNEIKEEEEDEGGDSGCDGGSCEYAVCLCSLSLLSPSPPFSLSAWSQNPSCYVAEY